MEQANGLHPDALLQQQQAAAAAAAAGGPAQFTFQPTLQPTYVLQGKPVAPGAPPGAQQPGAQGGYPLPVMALPGGPYLQPQAPSAGFPQLVGLPPGYDAAGLPTSDAGTAAANAAAASGALAALLGQQGMGVPQPLAPGPPHLAMPAHPGFVGAPLAVAVKPEPGEDRPSSSHSANTSAGGLGSDGSPHPGGSGGTPGSSGGAKSRYRGVSYDRKKAKWRVQIKVAALGKSGVSVGYFDTEEAAARAYDRAAIGLLGRDNPNLQTNFELADYSEEPIPRLTGKTREEVKTTLKSERIKQAPRRRFTSRQRTSRFMGVGSSNRKNQWQARILVHGKVTHLGYYETEEEAARVYDRVSLALHGPNAQTNFPAGDYAEGEVAPYRGLDREDLQRALGVKPMDKSSRFRGVSKKKGKWEAKVMVNRRWAYRELFDSEEEAARAYDRALWRLKPREARSYVNFKDEVPADAEALAAAAAAAGEDFRGAVSDGDIPADGADGDDTAGGFSDGGDFEYEYRPTKGTRRSASMRAKKAGSMPNLAAATAGGAAAAGAAGAKAKQQQQQQQQAAAAAAHQQYMAAGGAPAFVPLPGGGLQLRFGGGGGPSFPAAAPADMEEPLLIRVGSETHVLPPAGGRSPAPSTLGKRTGLQRIQSEPQFGRQGAPRRPADPSPDDHLIAGVGAADISDLMHDRDLFKGLDLAELAGAMGEAPHSAGGAGGGLDLSGLDMDFLGHEGDGMREGGDGGDRGIAGMLFEDEELALANLEFSRPRKIPKSMSMSQLSALGGAEAESPLAPPPPPPPPQQQQQGGAMGRPPPVPSRPAAPAPAEALGPLGQPIRRINTFTASLPSFEEGEEKMGGHGGGMDLSGAGPAPDDGDDLASHLLGAAPPMSTLDDALHMLDGL